MDAETVENAKLMIQSIREALARGTKHFNKAGKLLTTDVEVLQTLRDEKQVSFEPRVSSES